MGVEMPVNGSRGSSTGELARCGFAVERREAADGGTVIACIGELDRATVTTLQDALSGAEADGGAITLDLSGLGFIDSCGLATILASDRRLRESGARLRLVRGPHAVSRLFELTGLVDQFEFVDAPQRAGEHPAPGGALRPAA
jgi:anti-sigma B factor antagonist